MTAPPTPEPLLEVRDLHTYFPTRRGVVKAVEGVSFEIRPGEILGVVGESGCGKSITALSIVRLLQPPGRIVAGSIRFDGVELTGLADAGAAAAPRRPDRDDLPGPDDLAQPGLPRRLAGRRAAPRSIAAPRAVDAAREAVSMLEKVGIPQAAERRARDYPHQFSGGMRQRALIARQPRDLARRC